ncbi:MAG: DUF3299 domain-containing protein [Oligoflexia bacterium]|nr:DUF3299 domain-containing protein [Oligoflexia bacterium]
MKLRKRYWAYGLAFLIVGTGVFQLIAPKPNITVFQKHSAEEELKNLDNIPILYWKLLHQLDYRTGKGPKSLTDMDGKLVKIPGYVVPLSDNYSVLDDFLLVPDAQSCIHVPPPPPNLIVTVKLREPIPIKKVWNPSWVIGVFKIEKSESQYGGSAYRLDGVKLEKFEYSNY